MLAVCNKDLELKQPCTHRIAPPCGFGDDYEQLSRNELGTILPGTTLLTLSRTITDTLSMACKANEQFFAIISLFSIKLLQCLPIFLVARNRARIDQLDKQTAKRGVTLFRFFDSIPPLNRTWMLGHSILILILIKVEAQGAVFTPYPNVTLHCRICKTSRNRHRSRTTIYSSWR
jgi:hypothetical protein